MKNPAVTDHDIHELLTSRWSPRAYSNRPVEEVKLLSLFEAARWSPSGGNQQPWSFVVIRRDNLETHQQFIEVLSERNRLWAKDAPLLILAVAKPNPQTG